jgi:hypothetical protein
MSDTASNYCVIEQENNDVGTNIYLKNIARNSATNYVIDPFYISIMEKGEVFRINRFNVILCVSERNVLEK